MSPPDTARPPHLKPGAPLVAAGVVVLALGGLWLWLSLFAGPWRLVDGLMSARDQLRKAERALTAGANKKARLAALSGSAAADRAGTGYGAPGPLLDLAMASARVRAALPELAHVVDAVEHSAQAARSTLKISQNALKGPYKLIDQDPDDPDSKKIRLERITAIGELISEVRSAVQNVERELSAVDAQALPKTFRGGIARSIKKARSTDRTLADAEDGFRILPGVLGGNGPRVYFLAIQNSAELRGTGGSLLQFQLLRFEDGRPKLLKERSGSIYKIDRERRQLSIPLPEDAWYVAGIDDAKRAGNANWSPDWPLSARLTVAYSEAGARVSGTPFPAVDGVIGVDPDVLERLLPGIGRPDAGTDFKLTQANIVDYVLYKAYASFPIPGIRRQRLSYLVDGFYERLFNPANPSELIPGLGRALAEKHMQIWLKRPHEQSFIEKMNWDGGIEDARGSDYLYVVEQNVGGNKLDYFDEQTNTMDISLSGDDALVSTEIRIYNGALVPLPRYVYGNSGPLHRPMVNLYVPGNAELTRARMVEGRRLDASPTAELAAWVGNRPPEHTERGKKVWSTTLEIPPRHDAAVRFDYRVPGVVHRDGKHNVYRLEIQHQPKVRPETLEVNLQLPPGAGGVMAPGWTRSGDKLRWAKPLTRDVVLEVKWRR